MWGPTSQTVRFCQIRTSSSLGPQPCPRAGLGPLAQGHLGESSEPVGSLGVAGGCLGAEEAGHPSRLLEVGFWLIDGKDYTYNMCIIYIYIYLFIYIYIYTIHVYV